MIKVIIFGIGDLAKQLYHYLSYSEEYKVECFTVNKSYIQDETLFGKKIVPFESIEFEYSQDDYKFITAIGYSRMRKRKEIYEKIKEKGYSFINFIHKSAILNKPFNIGENNLIFSNVIIDPDVSIGNNNIIYSNSVIGHNCILNNHCMISIANNIAGFSSIEDLSYIGIGCTIIDNIKIHKECLIGAGSLVLKDTETLGVYFGRPAKLRRKIDSSKGIEI